MRTDGVLAISFTIEGRLFHHQFVVAEMIEQALLGVDFMNKYHLNWDWNAGKVVFDDSVQTVNLVSGAGECVTLEDITIPAESIVCHHLKLAGGYNPDGYAFVSSVTSTPGVYPSYVPEPYIVECVIKTDSDVVMLPIKNFNKFELLIPKGSVVGIFEPMKADETEMYSFKMVPDKFEEGEELPFNTEVCTPREPALCQMVDRSKDDSIELPPCLMKLIENSEVKEHPKPMQDRLRTLLLEFQDVFALDGQSLGRTNWELHRIHIEGTEPIKQAPRRIPLNLSDTVEEIIRNMEASGVIRPSDSPWASPVVIVKKKDGSYRFCVDYRKLNQYTVKDAYPLPRVDECLDTLAGNQYFTSLDLASGYWQVEMLEADKPKTAFTTKFGLYEWNVMPFGLTNAPATFQRLMERVLRGLQWKILVLYLDDMVIFSKSFDEHLDRLRTVFDRFRQAGLKLKPKKCNLMRNKVSFLGHQADASGIYTDPEKCAKIRDWKVPTNPHEVRVFTGLTSYYRCFIDGYAKAAACLHHLTRKDVEFDWTPECEKSFQHLKGVLSNQLELAYPDKNEPFILDTDACDTAIGACLSQVQDGKERVLRFGSRCLNQAERNYCTTRKELLAVVYFMDYFKHYLLGSKVTVRSDHSSLRWLKRIKEPAGQVARWIEKLAPFDWHIEYRAGKAHANADSMSRIPCDGQCKQCLKILAEVEKVPENPVLVNLLTVPDKSLLESTEDDRRDKILNERRHKRKTADLHRWRGIELAWDIEELSCAVAEDPVLGEVLTWNVKPAWSAVSGRSSEVKFYFHVYTRVKKDSNGLLWYKWSLPGRKFKWKLIVPKAYVYKVLKSLHDAPAAGHLGEKRCLSSLRHAPVFWFNSKADMKRHCRSCDSCFCAKTSPKKHKAPMVSFGSGEPLERIAMDIAGEFVTTERGNKYIYVVQDYYTKYVTLIPVPDHKAHTLARELVTHVFSKIGIPKVIHSDQGSEFMGHIFNETCKIFGVDKTKTSPWHPQSDGMVERMNKVVGSMLRQYVNAVQTDWDLYLPLCAMAYNSTIHSSTGFTPNKLMFGRELQLPLSLVLPNPDFEDGYCPPVLNDPMGYHENLADNLKLIYSAARANLGNAVKTQKHYYDLKTKSRTFRVGDSVWLYNPTRKRGRSPKLDKSWIGPYAIVDMHGPVLAEIMTNLRSKPKVVHVNKLAHTLKPVPMDWVKLVPKPKEVIESESFKGFKKLFAGTLGKDDEPSDAEDEPTEDTDKVTPDVGIGKKTEGCEDDDHPVVEDVEESSHDLTAKVTRSGKTY
jgi:transposase InsO family protein